MEAKYQAALKQSLTRLQAEYPNLRAVLLAGSLQRGEGGLTSDLDLWCLIDGDFRVRHTWEVGGVLVEVFLNPYQEILKYFTEDDVQAIHMTATGEVVYGNPADPVLKRLQELAQARLAAGVKPLTAFERDLQRYLALDLYEDALDVAEDPLNCRWVGAELLKQALEYYYHSRGRWPAKSKRILQRLAADDPGLAERAREYLKSGELTILKGIADEIFAPQGGLERFPYTSGVDEEIPLPEVEIVLIRHGWPHQDKEIPADEWVLDYTAYLELARYLDNSALEEIVTVYTSPLVKARQTASFYFAQWPKCREIKVADGLREVRRGLATEIDSTSIPEFGSGDIQNAVVPEVAPNGQYIKNYDEVVNTYLSGEKVPGWEELEQVQARAMEVVREIAKEARNKRQRRVALVGHGLFLAVLKQQVMNLAAEEVFSYWQAIPFGPYAVLQVNAFGDFEWVNEVKLDDDTDEFSGD